MSFIQKYRNIIILGLGFIVVLLLIQGTFKPPNFISPTVGGMKVCFKNPDGITSCEEVSTASILARQSIVNPEGRIYASFHPFLKIQSNVGSQQIDVSYKIEVIGNVTSKILQSDLIKTATPFSKELTVSADEVENIMDSLSVKKVTLLFTYLINVKGSGEVLSGSSSVRGIQKLIVQADTGIGGGTTSTTPISQTSSSTSDFQKTDCVIPYYYYSSSGIPRQCSQITSITVQSDKTVRVGITVNVASSPNTYGQAGGNIQMRVLDSQGNLIYAGQCQGSFCYIAGSKDNPNFASSSGVLIGENRAYSTSAFDTLSPRRIGGASEIIIFDKGTYNILLIEDGTQIAKRGFMVG